MVETLYLCPASPEGNHSAKEYVSHDQLPGLAFTYPRVRTCIVFGIPLRDSLRLANVPISTANVNGELYVWGYVPVVVAKW